MFSGQIYGVRKAGDREFRYIGMTSTTVPHRRMQHWKAVKRGRKTPFYDWLRQFESPEDVFFQSLQLVMRGEAELGDVEQQWIGRLRREGHRLLNLTDGGDGPNGYVWTEEQRKAAGDRARGRPTGVHRRGLDSPNWGRAIHSEEQKARWSEMRKGSLTGERNPNFGKFGSEHPSYGRKLSAETRARLSEQKRGANNPNFGKAHSPESNAKRSATLKGRPMPSSVRSAHTRHHTNKGVFRDSCQHCVADRLKNLQESEAQ